MKTRLLAVLATVLFSAGMAETAMASTINVDFGYSDQVAYSGQGAAASSGTVWNGLTFTGGTNLLDSNGIMTGVGLSTTASQAYSDGGNALLGDRIFVTGSWSAFDVIISGLNASSNYNLYLFGSNTRFASTYTVGSASDYALGVNNNAPFVYHDNYALLSHLTPINGTIDINVGRYLGSEAAVIGGLQLVGVPQGGQPVPEPSTILLLSGGLAGLALWRKRKSAT